MNETINKSSSGHKVGSSGASLAILCFFMPWMLVSCGGQSFSLSGWQLAAGATIGQGFSAQRLDGKPILFLILLAAAVVLYLAYSAYKRGTLTPTTDGYGLIALGGLSLLILLFAFSGAKDQATQQGYGLEYQFGLYGVVLGNIGVIVGGVLNLKSPT